MFVTTSGRPHLTLPWLLGLLVAAAWWPLDSYWQSDDYLAITYGQQLTRVFEDFVAPQYGIESLVLFLRPLISLSFAIDGLFGSYAPQAAHMGNALAHGFSAVLLAWIASRFLPNRQAFAAGLLWGVAPSHASSIYWAVGRVDSYTTVWIALTVLWTVKWCGYEARNRIPALVCFALALACKELAWVIPGIVLVTGFAMAQPGRRVRGALTTVWPFLLVFAAYFGWRYAALGQWIGGYEGRVDPVPAALGLGIRTAELCNPWLHAGPAFTAQLGFDLPAGLVWLGFAPLVGALALHFRRRRGALSAILWVLYLGCTAPNVHVFVATENPMILRQFYLAMMPLAVWIAASGWAIAALAIALSILPICQLRQDYQESWRRCRTIHEHVQDAVEGSGQDLHFVTGLPRQNPSGTAVEFHLFVDRLVVPPFRGGGKRLFALRPLDQSPDSHRIGYGQTAELPFGVTLAGLPGPLRAVQTPPPVANLNHTTLGPTHLDIPVLDRMVENFKRRQAGQEPEGVDPGVLLPGFRAPRYRVTVFTASGYVTTFVNDTGFENNGRVEWGLVLYGFADRSAGKRVGEVLQQATALDRSSRFPVLIEAAEANGEAEFVAARGNFTPAYLDLDRRFADWWP